MDDELIKLKNNNKKKSVFLVFTLIMFIGISLASVYFIYVYKDSRENQLASSLISINFTEGSEVINLTNVVPVIDEVGLTNTPYTFIVTNTSSVPINAKIMLDIDNTSTIDVRGIRYAFYINDELKIKDNIKSTDDVVLYTIENFGVNMPLNCKLVFWVDYYYETPGEKFVAKVKAEGESFDLLASEVHTVTLNANEGSVSPTSIKVINGKTYGTLPVPSRDSYKFTGWYTDASSGTEITKSTTFTAGTSATTLYAHWEKVISGVNMTLVSNEGFIPSNAVAYYSVDGGNNYSSFDINEEITLPIGSTVKCSLSEPSNADRCFIKFCTTSSCSAYEYSYDVQTCSSYNKEYTITGEETYYSVSSFTCFKGNTKVRTENGYTNIENIKVGDKVYSYNEITKQTELNNVSKVFVHEDNRIYIIKTLNQIIEVTPDHRMYVKSKYGDKYKWTRVHEIKSGNYLYTIDGKEELILGISYKRENNKVYNLEVDNNHTYYVTTDNYLVHNAKEPCPGGGNVGF